MSRAHLWIVGSAFALACGSNQRGGAVDSGSALSTRGGGCSLASMRSGGLGLLSLVNPEWAPVVNGATPSSAPVLVHGSAVGSSVSLVDFPSTHRHYDQNTALRLDQADANRLAAGNALESGEPVLELEWELESYPDWAWPGEGDRVVALGRWVFDCGHGDPTPSGTCSGSSQSCSYDSDCGGAACVGAGGTCHGGTARCWVDEDCGGGTRCEGVEVHYRTELHPPQAVAVLRAGRGGVLSGTPALVSRADVYVSSDGGGAGDVCVLTHRATLAEQLAAECFPLSDPVALTPSDAPPFATDFAFDVPLPPGGSGTPTWNVVTRSPPEGVSPLAPTIEVDPVVERSEPHLAVVVRMSSAGRVSAPSAYAASIVAGWTEPPLADLRHVVVTIEGLVVHDPMKPPGADPAIAPPPGWSLQVEVNGEWQQAPGLDALDATSAGRTIPIHLAFDQYLPANATMRIAAHGSSATCSSALMGQSLSAALTRFGFDFQRTAACLAASQLDLGTAAVDVAGPTFGAGAPLSLVSSQGAFEIVGTITTAP